MTSPIGYNNPAYSHQFDSSLYDYQYVSEIDPDYDGNPDREQEQIHLVHPALREEFSGTSEEFDASDESNQSIIVEECNNRRVTLICEKRNKHEERVYEDNNYKGAYHHNISEEDVGEEGITSRHRKRLDPPPEAHLASYNANHLVPRSNSVQSQRPQRQHRYEELDDYNENGNFTVSRHRYAEITIDENGYPSIGNEIEIEHNENGFRILNADKQRVKNGQKPRAITPPPTFTPGKSRKQTDSPRHPPSEAPSTLPSKPKNAIEMAELSPPNRSNANHTLFYQSPKRQPPIGASSPAVLQEQMKTKHKRHNSMTAPKNVTPSKTGGKTSVTHLFQARSTPKSLQTSTPKGKSQDRINSSRRNISHSFREAQDVNLNGKLSSPYRPTTAAAAEAKTAIITPILQRKTRAAYCDDDFGDFQKMSHTFQSTGNLYKGGNAPEEEVESPEVAKTRATIKRNKSVPNFGQTLVNENKSIAYGNVRNQYRPQEVHKSTRRLDYQYSPAKSMDRFSPIDRSRISLIDQTKISWSNSGSDFQNSTSGCLILGAIIQIATSIASCAICFYLFSKLGRRYYLDFGILAGFINFILGVLGFRSHCWRWLPNRNYVTGYILVSAFSVLSCAGFIYLITGRPMAGNPILDVVGGGICGISALTIVLAITGLTMSGCCKTPPPDNRVNNV